jgi:hypothetical protein
MHLPLREGREEQVGGSGPGPVPLCLHWAHSGLNLLSFLCSWVCPGSGCWSSRQRHWENEEQAESESHLSVHPSTRGLSSPTSVLVRLFWEFMTICEQ